MEIGVLAKNRILKEGIVKDMEKPRWHLPIEHLNVEINPAYGRELRRCQLLNASRISLHMKNLWWLC